MENLEQFVSNLSSLPNVNKVGCVNVSEIGFFPELRELCESNQCGNYGKNYTCPPHCGAVLDLIASAKTYKTAIVYQTVSALEDSFDIEGMLEAGKTFRTLLDDVAALARAAFADPLILGAGSCSKCKVCGVQTNEPCRFPETAFASIEAYGIQVSLLAAQCDMKYINGVNTVTYFGTVMIK